MNLHGIASGVISAVNPNQAATLQASTGYQTLPNGDRVPSYADAVEVLAQIQEFTTSDIRHLDAQNISRVSAAAIYITGTIAGLERVNSKGGDLITIPVADGPVQPRYAGTVWLTTAVLEQWPDWVRVAATMQDDAPAVALTP
jgi:hypothetical protein